MFTLSYDNAHVTIKIAPERRGLFARMLKPVRERDLSRPTAEDRDLIFALADLRALAQGRPGELKVASDHIEITHALAASLPASAAETLNLPRLVDLTLHTDVEGVPGQSNFRLHTEWRRSGQQQFPKRVGAFLETADGLRRLPLWMMEALDASQGLRGGELVEHWAALARFRQALDPGVAVDPTRVEARLSMTDFLIGLKVRVADRFSITPNERGDDFEAIPFSQDGLAEAPGPAPTADQAELQGENLTTFQRRLRERGALPAFRIEPGSFLVVEPSALPALRAISKAQRSGPEQRRAFISNPRRFIADEVEESLRDAGGLDGLSPEGEEEAVESASESLFLETAEFSERVRGVKAFERSLLGVQASGTTWLPEGFEHALAEALASASTPEIEAAHVGIGQAMTRGDPTVSFSGLEIPAREETRALLKSALDARTASGDTSDVSESPPKAAPKILDAEKNFDELKWAPDFERRSSRATDDLPSIVRTPLKPHQIESFGWKVAAWRAGLPGVLNADEQGLGKTLQTLAFLSWLKTHTSDAQAKTRGPILIVAPTSLLQNWEQEIDKHLAAPGLGHLLRLYGAATGARKVRGARGVDTTSGEAKLDLAFLSEAIAEGRAHRFWMLTTYTTLTNYQHSLGKIRFAAAVFDEIQNLKNPDSLRAHAARAMNVDFRIGLTGTPIENSATDIWAIMDQIAPGQLGTLKQFEDKYRTPSAELMRDLHKAVFAGEGRPPFGLRRLKEEVARDLPAKVRRLHPALMPPLQAGAYETARLKLAQGGAGAALKMLHHIRSVSVHPAINAALETDGFVSASARLQQTFEILRRIAAARERCLVFIEHREMQFRFIELARAEFGLARIDLINGDTPISQRQAIVNRFQRHLESDGGFDMLVLGPKAAGVGLTLTAATHVIHLSRWWNPAVEEQCNDRAHRLGQTKPVTVHVPMAVHGAYREHTFDCLLHTLMENKRRLARSALWPMADTTLDVDTLRKTVQGAPATDARGEPLKSAIIEMFRRDGSSSPEFEADGSIVFG